MSEEHGTADNGGGRAPAPQDAELEALLAEFGRQESREMAEEPDCPWEPRLLRSLDGPVPEQEASAIEAHLLVCQACRMLAISYATASAEAGSPDLPSGDPDRILRHAAASRPKRRPWLWGAILSGAAAAAVVLAVLLSEHRLFPARRDLDAHRLFAKGPRPTPFGPEGTRSAFRGQAAQPAGGSLWAPFRLDEPRFLRAFALYRPPDWRDFDPDPLTPVEGPGRYIRAGEEYSLRFRIPHETDLMQVFLLFFEQDIDSGSFRDLLETLTWEGGGAAVEAFVRRNGGEYWGEEYPLRTSTEEFLGSPEEPEANPVSKAQFRAAYLDGDRASSRSLVEGNREMASDLVEEILREYARLRANGAGGEADQVLAEARTLARLHEEAFNVRVLADRVDLHEGWSSEQLKKKARADRLAGQRTIYDDNHFRFDRKNVEEAQALYLEIGDGWGAWETSAKLAYLRPETSAQLRRRLPGLLERMRYGEDYLAEAIALFRLAFVFHGEDYEIALTHYEGARKRFHAIGDMPGEGAVLNNIGHMLTYWGRIREAEEYLSEALRMRLAACGQRDVAITLVNLGRVREIQGRKRDAQQLYQAARERLGNLSAEEEPDLEHTLLRLLVRVAGFYESENRPVRAMELATQAEEIALPHDGQGRILARKARLSIYLGEKRYADALGLAREAVGEADDLRLSEHLRAEVRVLEALALEGLGRREEADRIHSEALGLIDGDTEAPYPLALEEAYHHRSRLAEDRGLLEEALVWCERSLELVEKMRGDSLLGDRDYATSLSLQERFSERFREGAKLALRCAESAGDAPALREKAFSLVERGRGRTLLDLVFHGTLPAGLALATDEDEVLDSRRLGGFLGKDGAFFEYLLGEERSYLFAVTEPSGLEVFPLPRQQVIENLCRDLLLCIEGKYPMEEIRRLGRDLYERLFPEEVRALLGEDRQLYIAPDGLLHSLPFEVLVTEEGSFLIEANRIAHVPSGTVLGGLIAGRSRKWDPEKLFAGFAPDLHGLGLPRLRSEEEVEVLARKFPAGRARLFVGDDALRKNFLSGDLWDHRYVHAGTHAGITRGEPWILVRGETADAGPDYLFKEDLIRSEGTFHSDLVVLSACETQRGMNTRSEGIVGWTYAFFAKQVPSVVVSQWIVEDEPTLALMERFYEALARDEMSKSRALQNAKLALIRAAANWSHPYYWAPWVLWGDAGS